MNEPKRHHYIPQFILRNFCYDDKSHLFYYNKSTGEISRSQTKDVFMSEFLYSVDADTLEERTRVETDFAKFECEASKIIVSRFLNNKQIIISEEENEKLLLFTALMGFRSKNVGDFFSGNLSQEDIDFYLPYLGNGDFTGFWKRNLGRLVNCRSLKEVLDRHDIDEPIKIFIRRDVFGVYGRYLSVVECYGPCEFVISDTYPTVVTGFSDVNPPLELYSICPISSKRAILVCCNGVEYTSNECTKLRKEIVGPPEQIDGKNIKIEVKPLKKKEIDAINHMLIKDAKIGVAFESESSKAYFGGIR